MVKISIVILLIFISACGNEKPVPVSSGEEYYPLHTGNFVEMEVSKTTYSVTESPQNTQHFLRQLIGEPYKGTTGGIIYPIYYSSSQNNWNIDSTTAVRKLKDKLLVIENGRSIINLVFPLTERNFWNGNAYNISGEQFFEVRNIGKPMLVGALFFPKTITVIRQNDSTRISQKKHIEVYAENIGLIKREIAFLTFCYGFGCTGTAEISSGWTETSIIKKYGK
jgi:hypothetical protein